jgi:hypothetical protein
LGLGVLTMIDSLGPMPDAGPLTLPLSHKRRGDAPMPQGSAGSQREFPLLLWERGRVRGFIRAFALATDVNMQGLQWSILCYEASGHTGNRCAGGEQ